jgi:hypothetical protein
MYLKCIIWRGFLSTLAVLVTILMYVWVKIGQDKLDKGVPSVDRLGESKRLCKRIGKELR